MIHDLKILTEHFIPVHQGLKKAEVRYNDRDFKVGDYLILREYCSEVGYSGRIVQRRIGHVAELTAMSEGYVLISFK